MAILSMRTRKKVGDISLAFLIGSLAWLFQLTVLNHFLFMGATCNLPLTLTILWGAVFGSPVKPIGPDELRVSSAASIFLHQLASGSMSGALIGAFCGALYASVLPIYPLCLPLVGWISGYFCLRNLQQDALICIPLVLLATVFAESMMATQLFLLGRAEVFARLAVIALPEAILNALIAPFIYLPMRRWYDFFSLNETVS